MASMTYGEFGAAFVHEAVTPERIRGVIRDLAGEVVSVGPIHAGPGGLALASAEGTMDVPQIELTGDDPLTYQVTLPVNLQLDVTIAGARHHYRAEAKVRIGIAVHLEPPLSICVEPTSPTRRDVSVKVQAQGLQAKVLGRVGDIDNELRREIAAYVSERIEADGSQFTNLDLRPLMLQAWPTS